MARAAKVARPIAGPDADEKEAVARAAAVLQTHARVESPELVTELVISTWIIERMKRAAGLRLTDNLVFDLQDAKLRGMIEATLPKIADALGAGGFDFAGSFNELSKEAAVDLFVAGCVAYREAAVAAGEAPDFPFSDPLPDFTAGAAA